MRDIGITPIAMFCLGIMCVLAFAYMRLFVITNDPFDIMREYSVDALYIAIVFFLCGSLACRIKR